MIKSGIAATSLFIGGGISVSYGDVHKQMVGVRGITASGGIGWRNPYITDGLVAMWDGEWPDGVSGKTSQTATEWVDIIGGSVYGRGTNIIYDPISKCFDTNKIGLSDAARFYHDTIYAANGSTLEVVIAGTFSTGNYRTMITYYGYSVIVIGLSGTGIRINPAGSSVTKTGIPLNTPFHFATTLISGNGNNKLYYNGEFVSAGNTPNVQTSNYSAAPDQSANNVSGRIYAVRVYSRALTAEEIAANYAVDKERFGLT